MAHGTVDEPDKSPSPDEAREDAFEEARERLREAARQFYLHGGTSQEARRTIRKGQVLSPRNGADRDDRMHAERARRRRSET